MLRGGYIYVFASCAACHGSMHSVLLYSVQVDARPVVVRAVHEPHGPTVKRILRCLIAIVISLDAHMPACGSGRGAAWRGMAVHMAP